MFHVKRFLFYFLRPFLYRLYIFLHKRQKNILNIPAPAFTLSFDLDFEADILAIPKVLDILKKYRIKASFACVGMWIERYPDHHKAILKDGHEILNHSYSHPNSEALGVEKRFVELSDEEMEAEVMKFDEVCEKHLNMKPIGFRIPHFGPNFTDRVFPFLKKHGYVYDSSTIDWRVNKSGYPYKIGQLLEIPMTCFPHLPATLMDTWTAFSTDRPFWNKLFMPEFELMVKLIKKHNLYLTLYIDPALSLEKKILEPMCRLLAEHEIKTLCYLDLFNHSS